MQGILTRSLKDVGRTIQQLNFQYELLPVRRRVAGVSYRSYGLGSMADDRLLGELLADVSPDSVVFDVGAYIGGYAIPLARSGCTVHAFEPNPESFRKLRTNVGENDLDDVRLWNAGVSETAGTETFYRSARPARSSFDEANAGKASTSTEATTVRVHTVDSLVGDREIEVPDFVKIDVEGHELAVLRGARETLESHGPSVYLEVHEVGGAGRPTDELQSFFERVEYEVSRTGHRWICRPR